MSLAVPLAFDAASANNAFGIDLYKRLAPSRSDANLVISPFSITQALALAAAGGVGATRAELLQALQLPSDETTVQSSLSTLRHAIDEAAKKTTASQPRRQRWDPQADIVEWHLANRLFGQSGHDFHLSFLAAAQSGYAAGLEPLDFRAAPDVARGAINAWVAGQTRQKIPELIPPGGTTPDTRLILVNTLYLRAPWNTRFEAEDTALRPFHLTAGPATNVPTMAITYPLGYRPEEGFTTVGLGFEGGDFQFLIFLPDVGVDLASVAAKLTPPFLQSCAQLGRGRNLAYVELYLPKIRNTASAFQLSRELRALGVSAAFDVPRRSADFSAIAPWTEADYLRLDEVVHQTFLALDETGIEAAAGSAVVMAGGAAVPPKPLEIRVDRPFLFAVQHVPSGACLLLGHIADPR